jgi:hypothetical protein
MLGHLLYISQAFLCGVMENRNAVGLLLRCRRFTARRYTAASFQKFHLGLS